MLIAFSRYQKVGRRPSVWVQGDKNPENACAVLSKLSFCTLFKNLVDAPQVLQLQILVKIETTLFLVRIKLIRPPSAKHSPIQLSVLKGSEKFGFSEKNCDWVVKVVVECRGGVGWAGWVPVSSSGESTAGARPPPPPLTWGQVRASWPKRRSRPGMPARHVAASRWARKAGKHCEVGVAASLCGC